MQVFTDKQLITKVIAENDSNSFSELAKRHDALCFSIFNKYYNSIVSSGVCFDDVKEDKDLVILNAIKSFDPERNTKFSTWLGNCVRFHCLNSINKGGRTVCMEEKDLITASDSPDSGLKVAPECETKEMKEYAYNILNKISDSRTRKIFELRFFCPDAKKKPWADIAKEIGVSTQTAINLYKKGLDFLKIKIRTS